MIDRETVQKIKDAADIVEVVGDYVNLTRRGANYMGLCPFHNERTPSFSVSPKRNFCHCFSCGKGGSPVNFIMEKEGISYHDALLWLAKKYNITVHEKELTDEERQKITERESMIVASEWAMNHFHDNLYNTEEGRDIGLSYLYSRGLTDESIKKYKLGYSIDKGNALLNQARNNGFDLEVFKKIGLIGTSGEGRNYDKFRGRVMFPIRNASGKPVAFAGRTLKGENAKYINSPETPLYTKSNELYGIFEAKNDIVKQERVFLMEGYLDVISSWQSGVTNVVASSGTSLTDGQIALLHRFADNVTLVYDGDAAGIKASLRGIDMLLSHKLHVNVLLLPEGEDPDSFAKNHTTEEFQEYIKTHQTDFIEFKAKVLMKDSADNPQERAKAIMSVIESIACIPNEVERSIYIQKCSRLMNVDEKAIAQSVGRQRKINYNNNRARREGANQPFQNRQTTASGESVNPADKSQAGNHPSRETSMAAIERELIKYCVRYGFAPIEDLKNVSFENPDEEPLLVIEYVSDELDADNITFSENSFSKIFKTLVDELPEFLKKREEFIKNCKEESKKDRNKFCDELISQGMSVVEIEKAEEKFEAQLEEQIKENIKNFSISFSATLLMDHEDDDIRRCSNQMLLMKHQLSTIYSRDGRKPVMEEDRLEEYVPRALSELRREIIDQRIKELKEKINNITTASGQNELEEILQNLHNLLAIRSKLAENLGERILSPR